MLFKTNPEKRDKMVAKIFIVVSLSVVASTFTVILKCVNVDASTGRVIIKAVCFAAWCVLWLLFAVIAFDFSKQKTILSVAVISLITGMATFISTITLNTLCYHITYNMFSGYSANYSKLLIEEFLSMNYTGAFFIGFLSSVMLLLLEKYKSLLFKKKECTEHSESEKITIDAYTTLTFWANVLAEGKNTGTPFILSASKGNKVNVVIGVEKEKNSDMLDLSKYAIYSVAMRLKNDGLGITEVNDILTESIEEALYNAYKDDLTSGTEYDSDSIVNED